MPVREQVREDHSLLPQAVAAADAAKAAGLAAGLSTSEAEAAGRGEGRMRFWAPLRIQARDGRGTSGGHAEMSASRLRGSWANRVCVGAGISAASAAAIAAGQSQNITSVAELAGLLAVHLANEM